MTEGNISITDSGGAERRVPNHGQRHCAECGGAFTARRAASRYCSAQCRTDFINRRNLRGAILYDLYMAHRFERDAAAREGVLAVMNRLAADWRAEDVRARDGRYSWSDWMEWLRNRPYLFGARLHWNPRRKAKP